MTHQPDTVVNIEATPITTAPLKNVALCNRAVEHAMTRPAHLPGMIGFYGPSGWGKSVSAAYAANKFRAYYVEAKSSWTRKALVGAILAEMGVVPAKTIYNMADQVSEQLVLSGRPLIIDEMDHVIDKNAVEIVRDIYESSNASILLIGEEHLEAKLRRWERFHNRVLDWVPAQPADLDDVKQLAKLYAPEIKIEEALLQRIQEVGRGGIRRICVNIEKLRQLAMSEGIDKIGRAEWGSREFYNGEAPRRRV